MILVVYQRVNHRGSINQSYSELGHHVAHQRTNNSDGYFDLRIFSRRD
jgi:hypothetical protein